MTATRAAAAIGLSAAALALLAAGAPAPAQSAGNEKVGAQVERLDAEVRLLSRRLGRARAMLRRQSARLARLERSRERPDAGLRSPDGRFALDLSNAGVRLRSPSASVTVSPTAVTLAAPVVSLGGGSGCPPVVRLGDPLLVQRVGETLQGTIAGSSMSVFAC